MREPTEGPAKILEGFFCAECGGNRLEGTSWFDLNTGKLIAGEPPRDEYYCPDCEDAGDDAISSWWGVCTLSLVDGKIVCAHASHNEPDDLDNCARRFGNVKAFFGVKDEEPEHRDQPNFDDGPSWL